MVLLQEQSVGEVYWASLQSVRDVRLGEQREGDMYWASL